MNEELQSSNEELRTMNDELNDRTEELNRANSFLESILSNLRAGVAVLDRELRVTVWSQQAEDLWGLRADEVQGQHFFNLDIGLPVDQLRQPIRAGLAGDEDGPDRNEVLLPATNRRGKVIQCAVTCLPLKSLKKEVQGVLLLMEERDGAQGA
jgi:two-component system CheB/CheR fusion protein